ncbi:Citrate lyase beta subunit [Streptoalloteichus tenebrarius]|uniref:Citrate lyase beta subunit n=1 Tax=Streptoalloteichus tenebrarius (strain ATCC 17920 / DSM 40477 / JCM 4838 / CBS 697.72 / NBRC 16177 / NCIMB 11028 / NRRL B-12390 / A12253. 1 / ISP 5477) TaxID=1933 RepID=A0ABT1HPA9_STRSD|nr:aldolase/citrate lyase family protein [Streptoalloteichus tenebrarius]MCP2257348.1 Citrate lyase beta subunit [Streptoalloteichus tenebrarius]BFF04259.1 aldolase/citrate lyase family protein [Streptoalloteichus tenebrarius]
MARTSFDAAAVTAALAPLSEADAERARRYPGDSGGRQPVHTCYVPANQVDVDLPRRWGEAALAAMDEHAPTPADLAAVLDLPAELAEDVHPRVRAKLAREPVEDLRIDFEDGYGAPGDDQEDADAVRAAEHLASWCASKHRPPSFGARLKSFDTPALRERGVRTLDVLLTALLERTGGHLPEGFVLTFPKVTATAQVEAFTAVLELAERALGLPERALRFEIQVETTQSVLDPSGRIALPAWIEAGRGRVSGLHFGTYDYTAACGLSAAQQHLAHGACDFARHVMQLSAAGTGVRLSDGSTNVLPVGDADQVRLAWHTHGALVRRSLVHGFYQGWDLHPAQLVSRYAAVFAFFRSAAEADAARLRRYVDRAGGAVLDEPATAQALAGSLRRAVDCGALDAEEAERLTGLSAEGLHALATRRPLPTG